MNSDDYVRSFSDLNIKYQQIPLIFRLSDILSFFEKGKTMHSVNVCSKSETWFSLKW